MSAVVKQAAKQSVDVDIPLASFAGVDVEFQVGKASGGFADVRQRGFSQRSSAKIRVQDDAGRVDHRPQRMPERPAKRLLDGVS